MYTIPVATTAAPAAAPAATEAPDLPTERTVVTCNPVAHPTFSTTTLASGVVHPCRANPKPDGCVQYVPRTTLRVYAKVTVTLGTAELATDKVVEFEPLLNLEAAKILFNDDRGTINEFGRAAADADGVFKTATDLAHSIYLDLRDSVGVGIGSGNAEDLVVVINDICAVRRNSNDNGDYPEPDPNDADDPFGPCCRASSSRPLLCRPTGLGSGDVSTQDATEALDDKECGGPTLIDLRTSSRSSRFRLCRPRTARTTDSTPTLSGAARGSPATAAPS